MADIKPNLVDMKLPPRKMGEEMPHAMEGEHHDYPYGLCLHLEKEQIDALNLSEMPEPGEGFKVLATGVVTRSSMEPGGKNPGISLQLTALQLIPKDEEPAENEAGEKPAGKSNKPSTVLGNSYRSYD